MIITYTRSSSLNQYKICELSYYITYNLGIQQDPGRKTVAGTIVHKVMEVLALCKLAFQTTQQDTVTVNDSAIGEVTVSIQDFLKMNKLSNAEVDLINKTRINKATYKGEAFIKYGQLRVGREFVNSLIERSYNAFKGECEGWTAVEYKNIINYTWMSLEYRDGELDPRFYDVKDVEKHFEIKMDHEWAKYSYNVGKEKIKGNYEIKGTVDLIKQIDDNSIEVIDYKTGQRLNWDTGQEKTYEDLKTDKQLMLYYYALRKVYPDIKNIKLTIFFIRDGGPFTVEFNDVTLDIVENMLEDHFNDVKNNTNPEMRDETQRDFMCNKLCHYYKNNMLGSNKNICSFIKNEIETNGIELTTLNYKTDNFSFSKYSNPGEL